MAKRIDIYGEKMYAKRVADAMSISVDDAMHVLFGYITSNSPEKFMPKLKAEGYDEHASTYEDNKKFWRKCGIMKRDYTKICNAEWM